jgi:PAS domain S-box-containing protein
VNDDQHVIRDERGEPLEIMGSWSDITKRKEAEAAEDAVRRRLSTLLESAPAVIYSFKASGDFAPTFISENIKRLLGYCPGEYLENADFWRTRVHPEDVDAVEAEQAKLFEEGLHTAEYRFRKSDGTYCWVSDEQRLIKDAHGNRLEVVGSWSDITARRAAASWQPARPASVSPTPSNQSPKASLSSTPRTGWCLATTSLSSCSIMARGRPDPA